MFRVPLSIFNVALNQFSFSYHEAKRPVVSSRGLRSVAFVLLASALSIGAATGCQTATQRLEQKLKIGVPVTQVFFAKYEDVEAALKLAMLRYPQRVDNTEAGIFETDYVKGDSRFKAPHVNTEYPSGYRYRILIRLVRGKTDSRPAVKVVVLKQIEQVQDFFAEPAQLPSDGLEESVILYRIGRELTINKALQRAADKQNKKEKSGEEPSADF
jgi:hypothetical protein